MKKLLFIFNAYAGKGRVRTHLATLVDGFIKAGWDVTIHATQGTGDAAAVTAARAGEFDRIVCAGGDGTLHEVVDGLLRQAHRPEIAYIPAGTTNDCSKNLGLPRGMEQCGRVAAAGTPRAIDAGRFNDTHFVYVGAFGAFTDLPYSTPQSAKSVFGHLAYLAGVGVRLPSIRAYSLKVEYDGGVIEDSFSFGMVTNTIHAGGFKIGSASRVALDDGLFEVALVHQPKSPAHWQGIISALLHMEPDSQGMVRMLRTSHLKITYPEPLPWTLDGEFGGEHTVVEIENCRQAVTVIHGR